MNCGEHWEFAIYERVEAEARLLIVRQSGVAHGGPEALY
jgi:hypothetical protein